MLRVVVSREYVDIPVDGMGMRSYLVAPRAEGRYPGIVFFSDIFQLTEPTLRWALDAPPALLAHVAKQPFVRKIPPLRKLLLQHPNMPGDVKRGGI